MSFKSTHSKGSQVMYLIKMSRQICNRQESPRIRWTLTISKHNFLNFPTVSYSVNSLCQSSVKKNREHIFKYKWIFAIQIFPSRWKEDVLYTHTWDIILIDSKYSKSFSWIVLRVWYKFQWECEKYVSANVTYIYYVSHWISSS